LALQSNEFPPFGLRPNQSTRSSLGGPKQNAELGQFRIPKSDEFPASANDLFVAIATLITDEIIARDQCLIIL
jgi:hypothetical protein